MTEASTPRPSPARQPFPPPGWLEEQLRRVLRITEGSGARAEVRISELVRETTRTYSSSLREAGQLPAESMADHLWAALLQGGRFRPARFFRPAFRGRGPVLWVRRPDGADALARDRVEAVLGRQCAAQVVDDLDPARVRHLCQARLRNGMNERELARVLGLVSPARAVILARLG